MGLNITRLPGEKIYIGDNIVITYLGVSRGYGRISIEAPRDVKVLREELAPYDSALDKSQEKPTS